MVFKPAGTDHAIVSNAFSLTLDEPVSEEVQKDLRGAPGPWRETLPASREAASIEVAIRPEAPPSIRQSKGLEAAFLRPDGTPTWLLRIVQSEIAVECTLYTRWFLVWRQAQELLAQAMTELSAKQSLNVTSFQMQVVDRFETDNASERASALLAKSNFVARRILDTDTLWHQHIGWIQKESGGEVLQNVNIDVNPLDASDVSKGKSLTVLHLQRQTFATPISLSDNQSANATALEATAEKMHKENKTLLSQLLSAQMQTTIKLNG